LLLAILSPAQRQQAEQTSEQRFRP